VHPKIFRDPKSEQFAATVERKNGSVKVNYKNERANFGLFSWFLNPSKREIVHTDAFHMPNVTSVDYQFSETKRFIITSQSVPVSDEETLVYTDLTYNYGIWSTLAAPIIRRQAQAIIDQDVEILSNQARCIKRYDAHFAYTQSDVVYRLIDGIRQAIALGNDPRHLPDVQQEIDFWV